MFKIEKGTPKCGIVTGAVFAAIGALIMIIGFWKTLILVVLFLLGYFTGAVSKKSDMVKDAVGRFVPANKEHEAINFRAELEKEQEAQFSKETVNKASFKDIENEE